MEDLQQAVGFFFFQKICSDELQVPYRQSTLFPPLGNLPSFVIDHMRVIHLDTGAWFIDQEGVGCKSRSNVDEHWCLTRLDEIVQTFKKKTVADRELDIIIGVYFAAEIFPQLVQLAG